VNYDEISGDREYSIKIAQELLDVGTAGRADRLLGILAEAYLLQARKASDYQAGMTRDVYFPLGLSSYATMLNVKVQRLISLSQKTGAPTFESVRDTALDLINYASFLIERFDRIKKENDDAQS